MTVIIGFPIDILERKKVADVLVLRRQEECPETPRKTNGMLTAFFVHAMLDRDKRAGIKKRAPRY